MTAVERFREQVFTSIGVVAAIVFTAIPCLLLILSRKSPLHSKDPGFVNGFGLGVGFMFYLFVSLWFIVGVVARVKRLSRCSGPGQ